jgi:hypothetical protein
MFDLDRLDRLRPVIRPEAVNLFRTLFRDQARTYRLSVLTNAAGDSRDVVEKDVAAGSGRVESRDVGLSWPAGIYSLSHVALPFRIDDPLYGLEPDRSEDFGVRLGLVQWRGERGVLAVSEADLMRMGSNPFFPYLEERTRQWLTAAVNR